MTLIATNLAVELGGRRVLDGVSCRIEPGRITGIIGPNGAGKSTLLRALAGLIVPGAGAVELDGVPLELIEPRKLAQALAFLPQERAVHWPLAVRAVVALGRIPFRQGPAGDGAADRTATDDAMAAMDVAQLAERAVDTLSGGERARVLFARALAQRSHTILADEPTAGLDPAHALELFVVLQRLAGQGRSVAIALHDLSLAARFCHDIVVLGGGRVIAAGPRAGVMTAELLGQVFGIEMAVGTFDGVPVVIPVAPRPA
ncbi:MAG: ABC transporter ATP-binding protein [Hyphomicrobiaceae bacterium]